MCAHGPETCPKHQNSMFHKCPTKRRWNTFVGNKAKSCHFGWVFLQHKPPEDVFHPCSPGFCAKNLKNAPAFHQKACKGRTFHQNWALANYNIIKGEARVVEQGFGAGLCGKREGQLKTITKATANKNTSKLLSPLKGGGFGTRWLFF